eukprot:jgi/Botrbrau1/106/Bobra.0022s0095.1
MVSEYLMRNRGQVRSGYVARIKACDRTVCHVAGLAPRVLVLGCSKRLVRAKVICYSADL